MGQQLTILDVDGLRETINHEREENVKLKYALRNKIVNDLDGVSSTRSGPTGTHEEGKALLSESQALIEPEKADGWEAEYKVYEKRLYESYETQTALRKEIQVLKKRNAELEKEKRAFRKCLDILANKRVEDRKIIGKWQKKIEADKGHEVAIASDGLASTSEAEPMDDNPVDDGSESDKNENDLSTPRKRHKSHGNTETVDQNLLTSSVDGTMVKARPQSSALTYNHESNEDLFVGRRHPSEEPTQYQFEKPRAIMPIPEPIDTPAKKVESWNVESRGIPNLISSPVFDSSPPGEKRVKVKKERSRTTKVKKEDIDEEVQVLSSSRVESLNELGPTGFIKYTQEPETRGNIESSPPLVPVSNNNASTAPSSDDVSPLPEVLEVRSTKENEKALATPTHTKRSSARFHKVDFAEIDDDLRAPKQPFSRRDVEDAVSSRTGRGKNKSILIHVPTPQSAQGTSKSHKSGADNNKKRVGSLDNWIESANTSGSNTNKQASSSAQDTPTRNKKKSSILKRKKTDSTLDELDTDQKLLD